MNYWGRTLCWTALGLCVAVVGCSKVTVENTAPAIPAFYSVSHYDESRDPEVDLASTVDRATAEHKRILLQVGGEWCVWCARISEYMATNETVRDLLDRHFVVMKVNYPGKNTARFLAQYPECQGYPHLFVLEQDGSLLHSQGTGALEQGDGYDQEVFVRFLSTWAPPDEPAETDDDSEPSPVSAES